MTAQSQLILRELDRLAIRAEAPCRVDLAGGTLDLYPLCAFEAPVLTVNAAIDVLCRADVRIRTDGKIVLRADDLGHQVTYDNLQELLESTAQTPLDLLVEAVRFWEPPTGLELVTSSDAPRGSGLGASSATLVAVLGALTGMFGGRYGRQEVPDNMRLVMRAAAIEAKHLKVPTGSQDHIAALLGGNLVIRYDADGPFVEQVALSAPMLELLRERLLVLYTGVAHNSANPNWEAFKAYVEGDDATRSRVAKLKKIAESMVEALVDGDDQKVAAHLNEDWAVRRELAPGITNDELDQLVERLREAGADAVRPLGAGGGGSVLVLAPIARHVDIVAALSDAGGYRIPARLTPQGIRITRLAVEDAFRPVAAPLSFVDDVDDDEDEDEGEDEEQDDEAVGTESAEGDGAPAAAPADAEAGRYQDGDPTEILPAFSGTKTTAEPTDADATGADVDAAAAGEASSSTAP